jgi:hypothetical protein
MRRKSSIFKLLSILILTLLFVFGLLFVEWLRPTNKTDEVPLPKKYSWIIQMDAANFWKKEVYTVLFEAKDAVFLNQLRTFAEEKLAEAEEKKYPLSISTNTNLIVVKFDYLNNQYVAAYFDVTNPSIFLRNSRFYLSDLQVTGTIGNKAVFLTSLSPENTNENCSRALDYLLKSKIKTIKNSNKTHIQLTLNTNDAKGKISLVLNDNSIGMNGKFKLSKTIQYNNFSLKPSGFTLQSNLIPKEINEQINKFSANNDFSLPAVASCRIDYSGLQLVDEKVGLLGIMGYSPIPKINAVVSFKKPISVAQFSALFPESVRKSDTSLDFGSIKYALVQLNATTLFIGFDPSAIRASKEKSFVALSGDLNQFMQVEGNAFIAGFIQNMPPVKVVSDFFKTIDKSSIRIVPSKIKNEYKVMGSIHFRKDKQAINESAKLGFSLWKIYK